MAERLLAEGKRRHLLWYFLSLIAVVAPLTVAAEAAWDGWHGGRWHCGAATAFYCGCYGCGYPYYAGTTVICLTGRYGYAPNYSYGYGYMYGYDPYVRHHFHAAVRGVRRMGAYRSALAGAGHNPSSSFNTRRFNIAQECLDSYDGPYLAISS